MKNATLPTMIAGGLTCFLAGATASYFFLKPVLDFAETAPLFILSEQTNVLKHMHTNRETEIAEKLENQVWVNIAGHVERQKLGKNPPEALQDAFHYHCSRLRNNSHLVPQAIFQARVTWCTALNA